jgi:hypothetical protein
LLPEEGDLSNWMSVATHLFQITQNSFLAIFKLSKLEDQHNDLSARSIRSNEVVNTQRKIQDMEKKMEQMENKMNENRGQMGKEMDGNRDQMEKNMDELKISISQTLDGRLPKSDIVTKENRENKGSVDFEQPSSNKYFLGGYQIYYNKQKIEILQKIPMEQQNVENHNTKNDIYR